MKKLSGVFHRVLNLHRTTLGKEITLAMGHSTGSDPDVNLKIF
jgi:hypothetical protein